MTFNRDKFLLENAYKHRHLHLAEELDTDIVPLARDHCGKWAFTLMPRERARKFGSKTAIQFCGAVREVYLED